MNIGIIGLDTSHAEALTRVLHASAAGMRVTAAWPGGSPDLELSASRVEGISCRMRDEHGVELLDSPEAVAERCDRLMILSMDGRTRVTQVARTVARRRPTFIDKPLALTADAAHGIAGLLKRANASWFSASVLRFSEGVSDGTGKKGEVRVEAPLLWNEGSPGWFWYGVHAVELLFAAMGPGVEAVRVTPTPDGERLDARWRDGRTGEVDGKTAGDSEFALWRGGRRITVTPDFARLGAQIGEFFATRIPPVDTNEMLEVVAVLEAANRSRAAGGAWVRLM